MTIDKTERVCYFPNTNKTKCVELTFLSQDALFNHINTLLELDGKKCSIEHFHLNFYKILNGKIEIGTEMYCTFLKQKYSLLILKD